MNTDERIEALTQSLELLGHLQRDNEARFDARFSKVIDAIEKLMTIATRHEERIERLEKK